MMKKLILSAALLLAASIASAQTGGEVANHAVPIGKGPGVVGWGAALPGAAGSILTSTGASSDPTFQSPTGSGGTVDNLLPNVQWQLWSGTQFAIKQNAAGNGNQFWPTCSSFTTSTQGPSFTCANTGQVKSGDLVVVELPAGGVAFWGFAGAGYITCGAVQCQQGFPTAARVISVTPNVSIAVASPGFGGVSPAASVATTLVPIAPGDLGSSGNGPDGWVKSGGLVATVDDFGGANGTNFPGCERPLLLRKSITGQEIFEYNVPPLLVPQWAGRTVTFGAQVYQRVQGGASTWNLHIDDNFGSSASATGTGASAGYYQFLTATRTINPSATSIALYINLLGNAGDIFDVCLPTAAFVPSLVASQLKQNSGEIIRSTSHWNPPLLTPFIINFPATQICSGCGLYGWNGIDLEAISLGTVHNTISNVYSKVEWVSTAVDAQFFTGASVNVTNGLIFGLQASTQVSGKTFPTSIGRWPLYHDGTVTIFTGTAGLVPINATFDFTDVDVSRPTSVD